MCRFCEGWDLCWYWYGATSKMDSRLREKDWVFFVMYSFSGAPTSLNLGRTKFFVPRRILKNKLKNKDNSQGASS